MPLIRPRQRVVTALFPHPANRQYIVPKRGKPPKPEPVEYQVFGPFTHKPSELTFWLRYPTGAVQQADAWEIGFNIDKPPEPDVWVSLVDFIEAATNGQKQSVRHHARANGWPG